MQAHKSRLFSTEFIPFPSVMLISNDRLNRMSGMNPHVEIILAFSLKTTPFPRLIDFLDFKTFLNYLYSVVDSSLKGKGVLTLGKNRFGFLTSKAWHLIPCLTGNSMPFLNSFIVVHTFQPILFIIKFNIYINLHCPPCFHTHGPKLIILPNKVCIHLWELGLELLTHNLL